MRAKIGMVALAKGSEMRFWGHSGTLPRRFWALLSWGPASASACEISQL